MAEQDVKGSTATVEVPPLADVGESMDASGHDDFRLKQLNAFELNQLQLLLTPRLNKYMPHTPTAKQTAFLLVDAKEVFFGGAAGGGKSDALLMAALQYVDQPKYAAILFRKTYADLALPGALMDRAKEWLAPFIQSGEVRWNEKDKTFTFPSGATLTLGYLEGDNDKYRYQSSEFQFIGFDELTQILQSCYTYMFSRLRRLKDSIVPLRVRGASNPGGTGHDWVRQRFLVEGPAKKRLFIPANSRDNPYLDNDSYMESLAELDPITRAQLQEGDWNVKHGGSLFSAEWFEVVDSTPDDIRWVRYWDLAATEPKPGKDPDYSVGLKMGYSRDTSKFYIGDVKRFQKTPGEVEKRIKHAAQIDGYETLIFMEEEPGSSGKNNTHNYATKVLLGYPFWGVRETGGKFLRAQSASAAAERGQIKILRAPWNTDFLNEVEAFPNVNHDDQVDGLSGAYRKLVDKATFIAVPTEVKSVRGSYWVNKHLRGVSGI